MYRSSEESGRSVDFTQTEIAAFAAALEAEEGIGTHALRDLPGHETTTMADRYIPYQGVATAEATERMGACMKTL